MIKIGPFLEERSDLFNSTSIAMSNGNGGLCMVLSVVKQIGPISEDRSDRLVGKIGPID